MTKEISTEEQLNYNTYKYLNESYAKSLKKMAKATIKSIPKELLIQTLKELNIIETDWIKGRNKFKVKNES